MRKYKYLLNNIALFTISNFVSKILVFFMLPFYTNVLTTSEYGIIGVMQTTLILLVPALTMNIGEAALRFALEKDSNKENIFFIGLKYISISILLVVCVCGLASLFVKGSLKGYLLIFIPLFMANVVYEFFILFFQGTEKVPAVVAGSISCTSVLILCNLYFLLVLKIGLYGYILAQIISFAFAAILMIFLSGTGHYFKGKKDTHSLEKKMLHYSRPMIIYSTSSWINDGSDKYIVMAICGDAMTGLYSIANTIPAILRVFQRVFAQAWQLSATKSHEEKDSAAFFSNMYVVYNAVMVIGCSFLICTSRILASLLFKKDFYEAWMMVPPLLISVIFGALTGFLGSICLAYKDSKRIGIATGIGAALNVILNLVAVPYIGAMGAAITTAISYYVMYFFSFMAVRKYVILKISLKRDYIAYAIVIIQAAFIIRSEPAVYIINTVLFFVLIGLFLKELIGVCRQGINMIKEKSKGTL